ncbi:energy transducer TonB [Algoriphagus marincola]|uniref:Energy transducer TonB n=1 Tax=Algoriphagus marincola TaxID=264027 RepID=A0ABS7N6I6_9BACT|nr:energy transducer TonB [Algoriphagus marincola]MBY5951576.1 energy transducer TonB [Algoriphagus marincola]
MIRKLLSTLLIGLISASTFAQESDPLQKFNQFLAKNLKYSSELRSEKIQGPVTILLSIDQQGNLDKTPLLLGGSEELAEEVFQTLALLKDKETKALFPNETFGKEHLLTVEFKIVENQNTGFYIPERFDSESKVLKKLNQQIQENPYFPNTYQERAEYYESTGQNLLADLDREKAKLLAERELSQVMVVGYSAIHKKSLISD